MPLNRSVRRGHTVFHAAFGVMLFSIVYLATSWLVTAGEHETSRPTPGLDPQQVIRIQLGALRENTTRDEGIAVAFRFSSPDNRQRTGPLRRFASMIRSDRYEPLLNHLSVQYGDTVGHGQKSYTPVIVTDRRGVSTAFMWVLIRQVDGSCSGCWLTEAVLPFGDLLKLRFA